MDKIVIQDFDPGWREKYEMERSVIENTLGPIVIATHHIGSTSVPGLKAKPIIDIVLEVSSLSELDEKAGRLENLGYEVMGEFGITGRRYFRKAPAIRTHHIHAFKGGDPHITRHLAFRDYLIAHQEIAIEYGKLKTQLAAEFANDNDGYCAGKDGFVKYHEAEALNWSRDSS